MPSNPLAQDPTRTTPIRTRFVADLSRRFGALSRDIKTLVVDEDAFGLEGLTTNAGRWAFSTNPAKTRSFRSWLVYNVAQNVLGTDSPNPDNRPWMANYIYSSYLRGLDNAHRGVSQGRKGKVPPKKDIEAQLTTGAQSTERLQALYERSFEDLQGVTYQMSVQMGKILAQGLVQGQNPKAIARELQERVGFSRNRAETIARTEIIHAHAEGQLDSYAALGVEGVSVRAEWSTAGDGRVCPRCSSMEGKSFTLQQAHGLIPLHVNCRCSWSPLMVDDEPQATRNQAVRNAVRRSFAHTFR